MSIEICENCNCRIDTDYDTTHEADCESNSNNQE